MIRINPLHGAVTIAAGSWPRLYAPAGSYAVDPNTSDLYHLASQAHSYFRINLPIALPDVETGVNIVECVEYSFVRAIPSERSALIRERPERRLVEDSTGLVIAILEKGLLSFEPEECFVAASYTWHGCLNMAKLLRETSVVPHGEVPITEGQRTDGYRQLEQQWIREEESNNPWIRYGVTLAASLEKGRGNPIVDYWVPKGSPYWQNREG